MGILAILGKGMLFMLYSRGLDRCVLEVLSAFLWIWGRWWVMEREGGGVRFEVCWSLVGLDLCGKLGG